MGDGESTNDLFVHQINDRQVFVSVIHIGKEQEGEPFSNSEKFSDFFVHVNSLLQLTIVCIDNDNVGIAYRVRLKHWHLFYETQTISKEMKPRGKKDVSESERFPGAQRNLVNE